MAVDAVNIITSAVKYGFSLFEQMLEATGLTGFYLSMFGLLLIVSFLLGGFMVSVIGKGQSDLASSPPQRMHRSFGQNKGGNAGSNTRGTGKF